VPDRSWPKHASAPSLRDPIRLASIKLYNEGKDTYVPRLNRDAETFNGKLNAIVKAPKR
jgi:hypothetical protein